MTGGTIGPSVRSVIRMGDIRLSANMRSSGEGNVDFTIVGNKRATNPKHLKQSIQYMREGDVANLKVTFPMPNSKMINQAVVKSCYLAASMFAGYEWARATAPDLVRRIGIGEVAWHEFESIVYRFPKLGVDIQNGFMIGILLNLDLIMLTFPVGSEPTYYRGAALPFADQSITQYCQNSKLFLKSLEKGTNTIEYRECYIINANYQVTELHHKST